MISPDQLGDIARAVTGNMALSDLRQNFPGVSFTECHEDDIPARLKPTLETPGHLLFLFTNASGHCLEFTHDNASATGVVVATRGDEY